MAALLRLQGNYASSIDYAEMAQEHLGAVHGPESEEIIEAYSSAAKSVGLSGNAKKAESQWRWILELRQRTCDCTNLGMIAIMNNLAIGLQAQGKFEEAELMYNEALRLQHTLPEDTIGKMKTLNNLAITLQGQSKYGEAERLYQRVLTWKNGTRGVDDSLRVSTLNNLGTLYHLRQNWQAAWATYYEASVGSARLLGATHPDTIRAQRNMASVLEAQGLYVEAELIARSTVELYVNGLGVNHPDGIAALTLLARLLHMLRRYESSECMSRAAYEASRNVLGDGHQDTIALGIQADELRDWIQKYFSDDRGL